MNRHYIIEIFPTRDFAEQLQEVVFLQNNQTWKLGRLTSRFYILGVKVEMDWKPIPEKEQLEILKHHLGD